MYEENGFRIVLRALSKETESQAWALISNKQEPRETGQTPKTTFNNNLFGVLGAYIECRERRNKDST